MGVIDGFSLPVADGLYDGVRVADKEKYAARYVSSESADLALPQPTFMSISGAQLQELYGSDGHVLSGLTFH